MAGGFVSDVVAGLLPSFFRAMSISGSAFVPRFSAISGHYRFTECHSNFDVVACEVLTQTLRVTMASNHGIQNLENGAVVRKI